MAPAMRCCRPCRPPARQRRAESSTLVLYGDVPLTRAATLRRLIAGAGAGKLALLTAHLDQPQGYGRIVRVGGEVKRIVEEKDADDAERAITRNQHRHSGGAHRCAGALAADAGQSQRAGRVLPDRHRRAGGRRGHAGGNRASRCGVGNRRREQQAATRRPRTRAPAQCRCDPDGSRRDAEPIRRASTCAANCCAVATSASTSTASSKAASNSPTGFPSAPTAC